MATVAASAALYAFVSDRHDRALQNFEANFFVLLSNFESITRQSTMVFGKADPKIKFKSDYKRLEITSNRKITKNFEDREALRIAVYRIREAVGVEGYNNIKVVSDAYNNIFNNNVNMLGHYFRTIHHLYRLIDERCPGDKLYYSRVLRAQLSNEEVCLLSYNCIVGEGRFKFRALAVKFSLFHNLHRYEGDSYALSELAFFQRKLPQTAFRFEKYHPITFDD